MRELMAKLRNYFSYVVIDTPPVNAVTDASILAATANGTVLVVEHGHTTFPALRHSKEMLERVGAHVLGVVMNKVQASAGSYAYAYGYYAGSENGRANSESGAASESPANASKTKSS
jgi:Mrp family chromosome partitioning ATPase